jgi:hypothetical protein
VTAVQDPHGACPSPTSARDLADYVRASMRTLRRITVHRSAVSVPISARPVGDGFVEPDLPGEAACLTRPRSAVRDGTSDRRACSSVSPSRQWLRSLAVLVEERLELCLFRDEVGDQHGCCSGTRGRQPTGRWSQTGCGRSGGDQGHVLQVGVRSQGMSVSDGQAAVHSGACRSVGLGQNRPGARVESAGSKAGPVDVPALMPGLPHSAEPQWHIRHSVFSRLLTFTARRPATGSGVSAAARTTAARWPRSG